MIADLGVTMLAAGIGNIHGKYPENWKGLSFETLDAVQQQTGDMPLVLHGGTGILPDDFRKCISLGINKINIATATFDSVEKSVRTAYENGEIKGYYDLQTAEVDGAYKNAMNHIEIFGCSMKG